VVVLVTHDAAFADFVGAAALWMDRGRQVDGPQ
jgi:ABC-type polar amino acid transport system ATPase subunit